MRDILKKLFYLALACVGLASSLMVQQHFFMRTRAFYTQLMEEVTRGGLHNPRGLGNCDMDMIQALAGMAPRQGVTVGACDLFMYSSSVAVSGFLAFMLVYMLFLLVGFVLVGIVPSGYKKIVLILWSGIFLLCALPLRPALWLMEFVLLLYVCVNLPLSGRIRAVLMGVAALVFYSTVGRWVVGACATEFFSLSRVYVPQSSLDAWGPNLQSVFAFTHLGQINTPRMHDQGFPFLFLALSFLLKTFRRILWLMYDLWVGRVQRPATLDFLVYFLGLPVLIGNSVTPSYREFEDSYGKGQGPVAGARTMAWCIGVCGFVYTTIVMIGYAPDVRVLFPRCDLNHAVPSMVWAKILTTYVIDYLFLLATEQASVGIARLFGYGLRDNYERPWQAHNVADFWRRWNIYWREYHVVTFFYPIVLALARRTRGTRRWHLAVATLGTFTATFALNLLPLALLSGMGRGDFFMPQPTVPGIGLFEPDKAPPVIQWVNLAPSLAIYYLLEGLAVAVSLLVEFRRPHPRQAPSFFSWRRVHAVAGIALTFVFIASMRSFLDANLTWRQQVRMLTDALGITS